jgi:hypothetical protein
MNTSKRINLARKTDLYMLFGHGVYKRDVTTFTVPAGKYFIFISRTSRYLPQSVVTPEFYNFFTDLAQIKGLLKDEVEPPRFMSNWRNRTYGPGDSCPDLTLHMQDTQWPGMGAHRLPLVQNGLRIAPTLGGSGGNLKISEVPGTGVFFIVACRATETQSVNFRNLNRNSYNFAPGSLENRLQRQNLISTRTNKRRRENQTTTRRNKNVPAAKRFKRNLTDGNSTTDRMNINQR